MTFFNPKGKNGVLHLELILPHTFVNERTFLRIEKRKNPQEYKKYFDIYEAMWNEGVEPIDKEVVNSLNDMKVKDES